MQKKDINGEARVPLQTLFRIIEEDDDQKKVQKQYNEAIKMMGDFLQFLGTKDYFNDIQQEFNNSHNRLSIRRDENDERVKIYIDGKKISGQDT